MRKFLGFAMMFASATGWAKVTLDSRELSAGGVEVVFRMDNTDYAFAKVGSQTRIQFQEGVVGGTVGAPELPEMTRWIAIQDGQEYKVEVDAGGSALSAVGELYPRQASTTEKAGPAPYAFEQDKYDAAKFDSAPAATVGATMKMGGLTVVPVSIRPFQYDYRLGQVRVFHKMSVRLVAQNVDANTANKEIEVSKFVIDQANGLLLNASTISSKLKAVADKLLIITTADLKMEAERVAALHPGVTVSYQIVAPSIATADLLGKIKTAYTADHITAVLIFGGKAKVPLYKYTSDDIPSDAFYSFVDGTDSIADVAIGRIPVADVATARAFVDKLVKYSQLHASGVKNKDVLLVAHKEDYPGKYTANMETVRTAANPAGLRYTTVYGGRNGRNSDVLTGAADGGYALINYRGHGDTGEWWDWDSDDKAFAMAEVEALRNFDAKMSIIFNIACSTGDIETGGSLAEKMLFHKAANNPNHGAVAVLASTRPSYTSVNHTFDINLFAFIQANPKTPLGPLVALANNKMVRDTNAASDTLANVRMYVLLGDPLMTPWFE